MAAVKAPRATELLREEYGYEGSVDVVKRRLRELRPRPVRPAQRTGYRPGQVLQLDWAEMPTRPVLAGCERRVYALVCSLPYSGAQTVFFSLDLTLESFLEGHVRAFEWLGGVARECVYDNLRSVVARRERAQVGRHVDLAAPAALEDLVQRRPCGGHFGRGRTQQRELRHRHLLGSARGTGTRAGRCADGHAAGPRLLSLLRLRVKRRRADPTPRRCRRSARAPR